MNLLIHDLNKEEFARIADQYKDCTIVSDEGTIRPCVGCFSCWNKTPGQCIVKDGYDNMGYLIHHADEVKVISRYTYGGFSSFVKNVFDRSLGYVLPHFELVNGESHHQKRYQEIKPYTFIFYGHNLSEEEKKNAIRYVEAVVTNMRTEVKDVIFEEKEEDRKDRNKEKENSGKIVLLNASMRSADGNSAALAKELQKRINRKSELINLSMYLNKIDELVKELEDVETLVLCTPLYVDGLPSQLIRLMETYERNYTGKAKKIYVLANMGLYESKQLVNLLSQTKKWCELMNFEYNGSVAIGAGELVGGLMKAIPLEKGFTKKIAEAEDKLAKAIDDNSKIDDIYTGTESFPRFLYMAIANSGWKRMAKANGIDPKELYRKL